MIEVVLAKRFLAVQLQSSLPAALALSALSLSLSLSWPAQGVAAAVDNELLREPEVALRKATLKALAMGNKKLDPCTAATP